MKKPISISPPVAAVLLAIVLFVLSGFLPNSFGTDMNAALGQATNIVRLAVFLGIVAAGQTLVIISGSEGIDLSAGSMVTLSAILTWTFVQGKNERVLPALVGVLLIGAAIGFINGVGITYLKISPFVMTLGMSGVITGVIIITNHGNAQGMLAPIMTKVIARPLI
ncbi:MAG: ABC transporter permease, partial [Chloroflexi bacterium]|nr:ABC transporter permease [Chloroflexota bacterium]